MACLGCYDAGILLRIDSENKSSIFDSFSTSRCASCIGESARAQWFRHSDGWRSGSSTFGSGSGQGLITSQSSSGHKRSPWDSLPSLRQDSSLNDSGYKSARGDSLEQRWIHYPTNISIYKCVLILYMIVQSTHFIRFYFRPHEDMTNYCN